MIFDDFWSHDPLGPKRVKAKPTPELRAFYRKLVRVYQRMPCIVRIGPNHKVPLYFAVHDMYFEGHTLPSFNSYSNFDKQIFHGLPTLEFLTHFVWSSPYFVGVVQPGSYYVRWETEVDGLTLEERLTNKDPKIREEAHLDWLTTQMSLTGNVPMRPGTPMEIFIDGPDSFELVSKKERKISFFPPASGCTPGEFNTDHLLHEGDGVVRGGVERWRSRWLKVMKKRNMGSDEVLTKWISRLK